MAGQFGALTETRREPVFVNHRTCIQFAECGGGLHQFKGAAMDKQALAHERHRPIGDFDFLAVNELICLSWCNQLIMRFRSQ